MNTPARAVVVPLAETASPGAVAVNFSKSTGPAILESSLASSQWARFSVMAAEPVDVFEVDPTESGCPFRAVHDRVVSYPPLANDSPLPFVGGWIGFFSYESGLMIEGISPVAPRIDRPCPLARFALYDAAAVFDHQEGRWYAVAVDWPPPLAGKRPSLSERIERVRGLIRVDRVDQEDTRPMASGCELSPNMTAEEYFAKVRRAKRYIEAGDIYQVNLTQRFSAECLVDPWELYRNLRAISPSSHAAYLAWDDVAVLSSSPELFLDLQKGRIVTRPIKGTRPRGRDDEADRLLRDELACCPKERAELTMITDLLRNDLGRVCRYGSVRVMNAGEIECHPTVFHRTATIEGVLAQGHNWLDLLFATFPGGSITGAPKIRAMQIIQELEPTPRGVYCGSIGWIGLDGSLSLNIAIRTMIRQADQVHLHAGGAIVADSRPEAEYSELLAKAAGMMRAVGHGLPGRKPEPCEMAQP